MNLRAVCRSWTASVAGGTTAAATATEGPAGTLVLEWEVAGVGAHDLTVKYFSFASGVELFLFPCAMIAGMSLRQSERVVMLGIIGLALAGFVLLHDRAVAASTLFSQVEYANFVSLSVWSVAALIAFAALRYSSALAQSVPPPKP